MFNVVQHINSAKIALPTSGLSPEGICPEIQKKKKVIKRNHPQYSACHVYFQAIKEVVNADGRNINVRIVDMNTPGRSLVRKWS